MTHTLSSLEDVAQAVWAVPRRGLRRVVALSGPPASGKSTLAISLGRHLGALGCNATIVPMDGFHLSNQALVDRGLLDRKGAPETFDVPGFLDLVSKFHDTAELLFPTFDRARDVTVPESGTLAKSCDTVIVEGNYLLFDAPLWRDLPGFWDISVALDVSPEVLRRRLVDRWLRHGLSQEKAEQRAEGNDLRNARMIANAQLPSDVVFVPT
ncbi:nucleoside triphosphate hydrolase [Shimia sp. NS0008-38b]|uniref:AAA family ATPase n=1 Tax=Shimia sp. NS0008-38b TaxID=3127653 RepID=UPI003104E010